MRFNGETVDQCMEREANEGVCRFAIIPHQMESGEWVWLERYWAFLHRAPNQRIFWRRYLTQAEGIEARSLRRPPPPTQWSKKKGAIQ
jgi:hypothetical protein